MRSNVRNTHNIPEPYEDQTPSPTFNPRAAENRSTLPKSRGKAVPNAGAEACWRPEQPVSAAQDEG